MGSMVPGSPNFFQQFMQAYLAGQEQKRRNELVAQEQEDRKLRLDALKFEQNRIKLEDRFRAASLNRQGAIDTLSFLKGTPTPRQELPEGIPGPPQPTGPSSMQIPGINIPEMGINVPEVSAPIQYQEDLQAQLARQAEQAMRAKVMETQAAEQAKFDVANQPIDYTIGGQSFRTPASIADQVASGALTGMNQQRQQEFTAGQNDLNRTNAREVANIGAAATRESSTTNRNIQQENNLRGEYDKKLQSTDQVVQRIDQAKQLATAPPSGQNDMALVFTFMRTLDDSVVRETEYARAANIGTLQERAKASLAKLQKGELLTPSQRQAYVHTLETIGQSVQSHRAGLASRYSGLAQKKGLDPFAVVGGDPTSAGDSAGGGPVSAQEGQIVYDPQGRAHRIVNGQPVPIR